MIHAITVYFYLDPKLGSHEMLRLAESTFGGSLRARWKSSSSSISLLAAAIQG